MVLTCLFWSKNVTAAVGCRNERKQLCLLKGRRDFPDKTGLLLYRVFPCPYPLSVADTIEKIDFCHNPSQLPLTSRGMENVVCDLGGAGVGGCPLPCALSAHEHQICTVKRDEGRTTSPGAPGVDAAVCCRADAIVLLVPCVSKAGRPGPSCGCPRPRS